MFKEKEQKFIFSGVLFSKLIINFIKEHPGAPEPSKQINLSGWLQEYLLMELKNKRKAKDVIYKLKKNGVYLNDLKYSDFKRKKFISKIKGIIQWLVFSKNIGYRFASFIYRIVK